MLEAGVKAPEFSMQDKDGNIVSLKDFLGKKVVVYFYPKDSTPGCTRQACSFRNNYGEYKKMGIEVIGISKDSVKEKKLYGKVSMGVVRTTYIVDEKGMIEKAYPNANPDTNAEEILAYLKG